MYFLFDLENERLKAEEAKKGQEEQRDVEKQKRMVTELVASLKKEKAQIQDLQARLKISENDREEIKQTCERYQQDISVPMSCIWEKWFLFVSDL